jgi:hypothetical protein
MALRLAADNLAALALPPFRPPMRPRATAAGFFSGCLMLERLGMRQDYRDRFSLSMTFVTEHLWEIEDIVKLLD